MLIKFYNLKINLQILSRNENFCVLWIQNKFFVNMFVHNGYLNTGIRMQFVLNSMLPLDFGTGITNWKWN